MAGRRSGPGNHWRENRRRLQLILSRKLEHLYRERLRRLDWESLDFGLDKFPQRLGCLFTELLPIVLRKHVVRSICHAACKHVPWLLDIRLLPEACELHGRVRDRILPRDFGPLGRLSCVEGCPGLLLLGSYFLLSNVLLLLRVLNR